MATNTTTKKTTGTTKKSTTTKTTKPKVEKVENVEVESVEATKTTPLSMEEMMEQYILSNPDFLAKMMSKTNTVTETPKPKRTKTVEVVEEVKPTSNKIDADDDVTVVNLSLNTLILSTGGYGKGKQYTFNGFGASKDISYGNLRSMIDANESFFQSGLVYVDDERVIAKHQLKSFYKTMLSYEDMLKLPKLKGKELYNVLINLPIASSNDLNRGYEPRQFDYAYSYLFSLAKEGKLSEDTVFNMEKAYRDIKGKKIDIEETVEKYSSLYPSK